MGISENTCVATCESFAELNVFGCLMAFLSTLAAGLLAGVVLLLWQTRIARQNEDRKCLGMLRDVMRRRLPLLRQELLRPKDSRVSVFAAREKKLAELRKEMLNLGPKLSKDHIQIRRAVEGYPELPVGEALAWHEQQIERIDRALGPDEWCY